MSKPIRKKTVREKEIESKPKCLFDPLEQNWCNHYEHPPAIDKCISCINQSIIDALEDRANSEAMRWIIAYRTLKRCETNGKKV